MSPELVIAREQAIKSIPFTDRLTIAASGEGRYKDIDFTRDFGYFVALTLEKHQNGELPLVLPAFKNSFDFVSRHIGTKYDLMTSEEPGKLPHEIHGPDADQERLAVMLTKGAPVVRVNNHLELIDYFALDPNLVWNSAFVDVVLASGDDEFRKQHMDTFEKSLRWRANKGILIKGGAEHPHWPNNPWWKDSQNSLIDENGNLPAYPVAPLDVQSWAFRADLKAAELFDTLGEQERADFYRERARKIKTLVNRYFWMEEEGIFAPAIDQYRQPIRIVTSDSAIALWNGIVDEDKIDRSIERMMEPDLQGKSGLKTRSSRSLQYNPRDYQNGNVWDWLALLLAAAAEKLGRKDVASYLDRKFIPQVVERGFLELHVENENGKVSNYLEEDPITKQMIPVACRNQGFPIGAMLNRTAA